MATYHESGLVVHLTDGHHFRFANLPPYKSLSGQHLKEMDFAWLANGKLFLLEVRSYGQVTQTLTGADFVPIKNQPTPFRFQTLVDKVTDSLLMLLAVWSNTIQGQAIRDALPAGAKVRLPLKLVIAVDLPTSLIVHLQGLRDSLNAHLRGRIAMADVRSVVLIDYGRLVTDPTFSGFIHLQP